MGQVKTIPCLLSNFPESVSFCQLNSLHTDPVNYFILSKKLFPEAVGLANCQNVFFPRST